MLEAQSWQQRSTLINPSPRRAGAMVFDVAGNRMLLNGGTIASPGQIVSDTWSFNGAAWTQLNPFTTPPARWGHQLVRDTGNNRLVTFGGRSPSVSGLANDTWVWDGNDWSALPTVAAPSPRFRYGMVYDSTRSRIVLFGGRTTLNNSNETWEFDGLLWHQMTTVNAPPPREDMVLAFDASTQTTVLFGGYDNDTATLLGDTWEYRGLDWVDAAPVTSPSPRYRCAGIFDSLRQRVVMYGGHDGTSFQTSTYEYSGAGWDQISAGTGSAHSTEMYYGFDEQRKLMMTFGGVGTTFSDETWEYTGASTAQFGAFGQGCPHSQGISVITGNPPVLGSQFDMTVQNVPTGVFATIVAHGFSSEISNLGPLPFDLTPFGLPGCFLEVEDAAVLAVLPNGSNEFLFGFAVPNDTALINLNYYVQAFVPDAIAPTGLGGLSRPSRGVFGN